MRTQRHHERRQPRRNRPARYWPALLALMLWTLATGTGCRTQQEAAGGASAAPPEAARQQEGPTIQPVHASSMEPVAAQAEISASAPQRISGPPTGSRGEAVHFAQTDPPQPPREEEILTPTEFSLSSVSTRQAVEPPNDVPPPPLPNAAAPMPLLRPGMADEMVSVNFDNVEIRTVLKTIGDITGINFIPHTSVSGNVTVMSPTPIRLGDLYSFLQSILDVHGYTTIEADNVVKVVPKADAARHALQVRIGADPAYIPRNDVIVTQILPLRHADADEVRQIITPIVSTGAQIATYPRTNSLMITDTSANIHHIAQIIRQLDVEGSREKALLFPLTYASARVLSEQITRILERGRGPIPQTGRVTPAMITGGGPRVLPDDRTNSIIVIAGDQDMETIAGLVRQLDIQRPAGMNNVHVTYLKNADAEEVGRSLEQALAGMRVTGAVEAAQHIQVTPDPSTNALVIVASPQDFEVISQIIEKLDIVREQVLVEMLILEVSEESLQEIGVDWATLDAAVADSVRGFGMTNLGPRVDFLSGTAEGLAVGAWRAGAGGVQIGAILHALQKQSGVNILSTPSILTSNHRTARIIVGENRPFVTESRITETVTPVSPTVIKSFEYRDVGITLEITPHISQSGLIRLEIDSEFTKLIEDVMTLSLDTPATAKRTAQTVVTMHSGATVVIGGLMRDDTTRAVKKVPIVGDLPVLGALFRSERNRTQKTNLLLFITPHIMSTQDDLLNMTDRKRDEMPPFRGNN